MTHSLRGEGGAFDSCSDSKVGSGVGPCDRHELQPTSYCDGGDSYCDGWGDSFCDGSGDSYCDGGVGGG